VGELDVVAVGPGTHLVSFVRGEVVEQEREPDPGRVEGADLGGEGEELNAGLVLGDLAGEDVVAEVEGAEHVAHTVGAFVGGADPIWVSRGAPRPSRPAGLQVERPELVQTDDPVGITQTGLGEPSTSAYNSRIRFFFCSNSGSFERFHVLRA